MNKKGRTLGPYSGMQGPGPCILYLTCLCACSGPQNTGFLVNTRLHRDFNEARCWNLVFGTRCLIHSRLTIMCSSTGFYAVVASHRPCIYGDDGSLPEARWAALLSLGATALLDYYMLSEGGQAPCTTPLVIPTERTDGATAFLRPMVTYM